MATTLNASTVYLRTLGRLHLEGVPAQLSSPRKVLSLLAYLARRGPKAIPRAELAGMLWGNRDESHARQSLRQALLELKRTLGDGLVIDQGKVRLAPGYLETDVTLFERDLAAGRWREAAERWAGDFLTGCEDVGGEEFRAWLERERESLRRRLAEALDWVVLDARMHGAWDLCLTWARRWIEWLPFDERGHRRLVECLQHAGLIEEARHSHAAFSLMLQTELGAAPSPEFLQLGSQLEQRIQRSAPTRNPGSAALFTPDLIGRSAALAELREGWARVRSGEATTILVEGEAGIGKTRVCEEFLRQLDREQERPFVVQVRGHHSTAKKEFGLIHEIVMALLPGSGLGAASPGALAELARVTPALRHRFPNVPEPVGTQPRLEDGLAEVLTAMSEEGPLILYIDDLPNADAESQQTLSSVIHRLNIPVLFLVTARLGENQPSPEYVELASRTGCRRLKLQLLRPHDVDQLLSSMLELPAPARQRLAAQLHDAVGGNPFYVIELTAALVDEGLLTFTEVGTWQVVPGGEEHHLPFPQSIREVIARRLDRLSAEVRAVVDAASVLGRSFDPALVQSMAAAGMSSGGAAFEELIGRRILRQAPATPALLEFTHEIIWRVTYDLLHPKRRKALHRMAAKRLRAAARWDNTARASFKYHRARAGARPRLRWHVPVIAAVALAIVPFLATALISPERRASFITLLTRQASALKPSRIVVAPLTNHTGDTALTSLGALAADWIAQGLMRTTQFEVVDPRTASIATQIVERMPTLLRDRNRAIAIAEETGSGTVLSGDLFQEGESLRVLMQVTDAGSGKIIRTVDPVLGTVSKPSTLVETLGNRAVAAVAAAVDTTSRGFSAALGVPPSYEAYTEVSRAWESFFREDFPDVFRRLDRASQIDTGYMTPLLMRAYVNTRLGEWPAVDSLLRRLAAHLNTITPAEQTVYELLQADVRGDLWARLRASRELMRLTPASVEGYTLTASSALFVNRPREALETVEQVDPDRGLLLVAPYYWINHTAALHRLGDHRAELRSARMGVRRFPNRFVTHVNLLFALAALGDVRSLRRELARTTRDDPSLGGNREKALLVWRELKAHGRETAAAEWLAGLVAEASASPGDTTLEGALREGDIQYASRHWEAATRIYAEGLSRHPLDPTLLGRLGTTAAHQGNREEAERVDQTLARLSTPYLFGKQTYARARIAAALGDRAAAVELLRKAWAEGRPLVFDNLSYEDVHCDAEFKPLRAYLPFQMLVRSD